MLEGGHEYDGRPIVPFDELGMRRGPPHPGGGHHLGGDRLGVLSPHTSRAFTEALRASGLTAPLFKTALARMHAMIEERRDRMKTDAREEPLIAVGGGCFLVPERLPGVSEVVHDGSPPPP